jgi:hypothetical protein
MAFMVPEYKKGKYAVGQAYEGEIAVPIKHADSVAWHSDYTVVSGWFVRLVGPGTDIGTQAVGPFKSKSDAERYIEDTYHVDSGTGVPFGEDDEDYDDDDDDDDD